MFCIYAFVFTLLLLNIIIFYILFELVFILFLFWYFIQLTFFLCTHIIPWNFYNLGVFFFWLFKHPFCSVLLLSAPGLGSGPPPSSMLSYQQQQQQQHLLRRGAAPMGQVRCSIVCGDFGLYLTIVLLSQHFMAMDQKGFLLVYCNCVRSVVAKVFFLSCKYSKRFVSKWILNVFLPLNLSDELTQYLGEQYGLRSRQRHPCFGDTHGGERLCLSGELFEALQVCEQCSEAIRQWSSPKP